MTPEQEAVLHDIHTQLRGPELAGWPQLGTDADGRHHTLAHGIAATLARIEELRDETSTLRAQVSELRTEISELEATTADLTDEVRRLEDKRWPWPLSLIEGPAGFVGTQLSRLESLLGEAPGVPGGAERPDAGRSRR